MGTIGLGSFSLHFNSADKVALCIAARCSVNIFLTILKVLSGAAFEFGIHNSALAGALRWRMSRI